MRARSFVFAVLMAVTAGSALAKDEPKAVSADNKEAFTKVEASVKSQMTSGGRYQFVRPDERSKVEAKLGEMGALFDKHDTVAAMSQEDRLALFNAQEVVNGILTQRDGERMICKKEAPIGSHIPVTSCHTYAQEQEMHKSASKQMDDWSRRQSTGGGQ